MALRTFEPAVRQSPGTKIKPIVKLKKAEFGDGYTASAPNGINNVKDQVELNWDSLLPEEALAMDTFMREHKGATPFYYDVDEGVVKKWKCETWQRGRAETHTFSATFVEDFSLGT